MGCSHRLEDLVGVPPMPISDLPKHCLCGAEIVYATTVTFHPAPPAPSKEKDYQQNILGLYLGRTLTVTEKMTRSDIARILGRN